MDACAGACKGTDGVKGAGARGVGAGAGTSTVTVLFGFILRKKVKEKQ